MFIEALQYVCFDDIFQGRNLFLFGAVVFGISAALVIGAAAIRAPGQMRAAGRNLPVLFVVNVLVCLSWIAILISVQVIKPAIAYTLGAGAMPLAAWAAHRAGHRGGASPRGGHPRGRRAAQWLATVGPVDEPGQPCPAFGGHGRRPAWL